jgi:F0F1-type ATP synthase assembly protein I
MSQFPLRPESDPPPRSSSDRGSDRTSGGVDPWSITAYLLSGMILGGGAGWLLDRWFDTEFVLAIGLIAGTALAFYRIFHSFGSS